MLIRLVPPVLEHAAADRATSATTDILRIRGFIDPSTS